MANKWTPRTARRVRQGIWKKINLVPFNRKIGGYSKKNLGYNKYTKQYKFHLELFILMRSNVDFSKYANLVI